LKTAFIWEGNLYSDKDERVSKKHLKALRHGDDASDVAICIDEKGRTSYATDGISLITIPDCFNFILCFFREENYRNDGQG
jgi:hypothetical protein